MRSFQTSNLWLLLHVRYYHLSWLPYWGVFSIFHLPKAWLCPSPCRDVWRLRVVPVTRSEHWVDLIHFWSFQFLGINLSRIHNSEFYPQRKRKVLNSEQCNQVYVLKHPFSNTEWTALIGLWRGSFRNCRSLLMMAWITLAAEMEFNAFGGGISNWWPMMGS